MVDMAMAMAKGDFMINQNRSDIHAEIRRRKHDKNFMRGVKACVKGEKVRDGFPNEWYEGYSTQYQIETNGGKM